MVGMNEFQNPEVFKYQHKCSLYQHFPSPAIVSPGEGLSSTPRSSWGTSASTP